VRISVTSAGTDAGIPHLKAFKLDGEVGRWSGGVFEGDLLSEGGDRFMLAVDVVFVFGDHR
jgi:hypothetical protein